METFSSEFGSRKNILDECTYIVDENIIATIKMRKKFCYPFKIVIFPILQEQYWTYFYCSPISYRSSNFAIAKVVALNIFAWFFVWVLYTGSFLYCFLYTYRSTNYCDSDKYRSFLLLKAIAIRLPLLFANAF